VKEGWVRWSPPPALLSKSQAYLIESPGRDRSNPHWEKLTVNGAVPLVGVADSMRWVRGSLDVAELHQQGVGIGAEEPVAVGQQCFKMKHCYGASQMNGSTVRLAETSQFSRLLILKMAVPLRGRVLSAPIPTALLVKFSYVQGTAHPKRDGVGHPDHGNRAIDRHFSSAGSKDPDPGELDQLRLETSTTTGVVTPPNPTPPSPTPPTAVLPRPSSRSSTPAVQDRVHQEA